MNGSTDLFLYLVKDASFDRTMAKIKQLDAGGLPAKYESKSTVRIFLLGHLDDYDLPGLPFKKIFDLVNPRATLFPVWLLNGVKSEGKDWQL